MALHHGRSLFLTGLAPWYGKSHIPEEAMTTDSERVDFVAGQVNGLLGIVNALVQTSPNLQTLGRAFASSADAQEKGALNVSPAFLAGQKSIRDGIKQLFVAAHQRR